MKRGFQKIFAAGLAVAAALSLAACGDGNGNGKPAGGDAFVYVPEYVSLGDERISLSNVAYEGGKLYYSGYVYDEATGISSNPIFCYDLASGSREEIKPDRAELENAWMQQMAVDQEGNIYIAWDRTRWSEDNPDNYTRETLLGKYDASGSPLFFKDISKELQSDGGQDYVQRMAVDASGRVCLVCSGTIRFYDGDGNFQGQTAVEDDNVDFAFQGKDGKVYIAYYSWDGEQRGYKMMEVDFDGKKLGEPRLVPMSNVNSMGAGAEKDILMSDSSGLYEYDMAAGTAEKVLDWLDCDINGQYVQMVSVAEDGRLIVAMQDWESNKSEVAFLKKTKASEVVQKEEIVIGTLYMSQELRSAAVAFNKSNEKYHVTVREYRDQNSDMTYEDAITNMNNDITSADCPDILLLSTELNIDALAEKGVFADLNPFLDSSAVLKRDSFVESAVKGYTYGDTLIGIPKNFYISALAAKTSQVGDKMGWSLQDIMDFAKRNPGAELLEYASRDQVMMMLMTFNENTFIDWKKGTCNFDCDEFKKLLEFSAGFPEEYDYNYEESTPSKLATGKLLLYGDSIGECNGIQLAEAMFGEPVTWIGYPTMDGSMGCAMYCDGVLAIAGKSKNKEGAWAYIESYLTSEGRMYSWGFPSIKEKLEEKIAEAMKVEYVLDEDGNPMLDENGEPVYANMGGMGWGDWEYTYHPCTEEEIATLRQLIDVAVPLKITNSEVLKIIQEEAAPYYAGQKSLDEAAGQIQSRLSMYVSENS